MSDINYSKIGFCDLCHKEVAVITPEKIYWMPIRRLVDFNLSNGSILHSTVCMDCESSLEEDKFDELYSSILGGWKEELESIPEMPQSEKDEYMNKYSQFKILERT